MCWITKNTPIKQIADKDIPVKKILKEWEVCLVSPCYDTCKWSIGKTKVVKMEESVEEFEKHHYQITRGLHSCEDIHLTWCYDDNYTWVNADGEELFTADYGECLYDAVIPAGSEYYMNEHGDYVSNKLKIIGKAYDD